MSNINEYITVTKSAKTKVGTAKEVPAGTKVGTAKEVPAEERRELSTEEQILLAAEQEFLAKGFNGARTVAIANAAGVTHAMLHYYFRTKEHLFEQVLNAKIDLMVKSVLKPLIEADPDADLLEGISDFIRNHYRFIADNERVPLFLLNELSGHPERMNIIKQKFMKEILSVSASLQQRIDNSAKRGETAPINLVTLLTDIAALNLFSIISRPLAQSISGISAEDYDNWRINENITMIAKRLATSQQPTR